MSYHLDASAAASAERVLRVMLGSLLPARIAMKAGQVLAAGL
jgi:hypothetical protein